MKIIRLIAITISKPILPIIVLLMLLGGCTQESPLPVKADFDYQVKDNNYSVPVRISFSNKSTGAEQFRWSFEQGLPASLDKSDPGTIVFDKPGNYQVQLLASNSDGQSDIKQVLIKIDSAFNINYRASFVSDSFAAAQVRIINRSSGPETYTWSFEGGVPASFVGPQPGLVVFAEPGPHRISLSVSNGRISQNKDTILTVAANLAAAFALKLDYDDLDTEAPVKVFMVNNSISATTYLWSAPGANVSSSGLAEPYFIYTNAGSYTITLHATNGKQSQQSQQSLTVLANTNLRVLENVRFGVGSAHNSIGAYFSTTKRKVYPKDSLQNLAGLIDVVFYGLNSSFGFNRFVAPASSLDYGLGPVSNGSITQYINSLENCNCNVVFSAATFDAMTNDAPLQAINFTQTLGGLGPFSNAMVPRIVLFKTAAGIKGAIKIKSFVSDGAQSYILVDMKYQKLP